jgi:hypothetical protein
MTSQWPTGGSIAFLTGGHVSLTVDAVTRLAKNAARAASPALEVVGVTLGGGADSGYVEILLTIRGCRTAPCQLEIGAFRHVAEAAFEEDLTGRLRDHMATHHPSS